MSNSERGRLGPERDFVYGGEKRSGGTLLAHLMFGLPGICCPPTPGRTGPGLQRVRGDLRTLIGDLGLLAPAVECHAVCRRQLYRRRILVHRIHFVRESRSHRRQGVVGHLCRDRTRGRSVFCRSATGMSLLRNFAVSVAGSELACLRQSSSLCPMLSLQARKLNREETSKGQLRSIKKASHEGSR
jgi:hypothetical protein